MRFPSIPARDLEGHEVRIPDDFRGRGNLVVLAFQRWHQDLIDSWGPDFGVLEEAYPGLEVWEVPALSSAYRVWRPFIDGGMRAGIPDPRTRRHTLTAYVDLKDLVARLGLSGRETIHLYLLDEGGTIVWLGEGGFSSGLLQGAHEALAGLFAG